jgi:hypothetical protein
MKRVDARLEKNSKRVRTQFLYITCLNAARKEVIASQRVPLKYLTRLNAFSFPNYVQTRLRFFFQSRCDAIIFQSTFKRVQLSRFRPDFTLKMVALGGLIT